MEEESGVRWRRERSDEIIENYFWDVGESCVELENVREGGGRREREKERRIFGDATEILGVETARTAPLLS